MPSKIIITSDSTTDLSPALRERYGIQLMPLGINLNDKEYTDGIDIDPEMIYENYRRNKTLPKTAAPNHRAGLQRCPLHDQLGDVLHLPEQRDRSPGF